MMVMPVAENPEAAGGPRSSAPHRGAEGISSAPGRTSRACRPRRKRSGSRTIRWLPGNET